MWKEYNYIGRTRLPSCIEYHWKNCGRCKGDCLGQSVNRATDVTGDGMTHELNQNIFMSQSLLQMFHCELFYKNVQENVIMIFKSLKGHALFYCWWSNFSTVPVNWFAIMLIRVYLGFEFVLHIKLLHCLIMNTECLLYPHHLQYGSYGNLFSWIL